MIYHKILTNKNSELATLKRKRWIADRYSCFVSGWGIKDRCRERDGMILIRFETNSNLQSQDAGRLHTCPTIWLFPNRSFQQLQVQFQGQTLKHEHLGHHFRTLRFEQKWFEIQIRSHEYVALDHSLLVQLKIEIQ